MKKFKLSKRTLALGLLLGVVFSFLLPVLAPTAKVHAIPAESERLELERRKLSDVLTCMDDDIFDTDDEISSFNDMFQDHRWAGADKSSANAEIAIWGLDRNSNGTATCKNTLMAALAVLGKGTSDQDILEALTDGKYTNIKSPFPGSDVKWEKLRDAFVRERDARRQKILADYGGPVYDFMIRKRLLPLANICYTIANETDTLTSLGSRDFSATLADGTVATFIYKGDNAVRDVATTNNSGWYNDDGSGGRTSRIGDIQVSALNPGGGHTVVPLEDGFYPIGRDRSIIDAEFGATNNEYNGVNVNRGLVSCNLLESQKDFIFGAQFKFDSAGKLTLFDPITGLADTSPISIVANQGSGAQTKSCESEGGVMSWVICPLLFLGDKAIRILDDSVNNLLEVPNDYFEKADASGKIPIEEAWKRIRSIAYLILIPVMLIMVIGTALGFEFISAYTVKRAMPRLIAAVIFIALSFAICKFLIVLTNDVGSAMSGLITGAFTGTENVTLAQIFSPDGTDSVTTSAVLLGVAGTAFAVGSIGILLSYVLVALVGIAIGFFLLSFRQMLLIALVVLSPLAIIAWIFPGNDKLWKLWWGTFSKLLLLFPLIMILVATGKSFAVLVGVTDSSLVSTLLKLVAYIGPYFMIPATFKFAGGVFGNIAGMANDRGKGLFDRQKKYRGRKAQENYRDFKAGDKAWRPRSFNNLGERVGVGVGGRFGVGARGRASIRTQRRNNAAERGAKDEGLKQLALASDDGNAVMALAGTPGGARAAADDLRDSWLQDDEQYQRAVASGDVATQNARRQHFDNRANTAYNEAMAVGVTRSRSQAAMSTMMQNKARAIVGGQAGRDVLERGLNRLHGESGADAGSREETRQAARFFARESGRADLGGDSVMDGFDRTGAYKTVRGYTANVQAVSDTLTTDFQQAVSSGDEVGAIEAASKIAAMRNSMGPDVAEENKAIITDLLQQVGVDMGSVQSVDEQLGSIISSRVSPIAGPVAPGVRSSNVTQHIRTRAGLYDQGDPNLRNPTGGPLGGPSDRRLKTDIHYLTTVQELKIYSFKYFWSDQRYVGVMAQDLIDTHPEALSTDNFGYYRVNYSALGLRMVTLEEWNRTKDLTLALTRSR